MDSMAAPQGHRRRRSTHTSPATRSRGPEDRKPHGTADDRDNEVQGGRRLETDDDDSGLSDEDLHDDEEAGLTRKQRDRKRDKRRRNTQFDQRIVRGGTISEEEKREADKNVMRNLVINGVLIGLWYLFSLGISIVRNLGHPLPLVSLQLTPLTFRLVNYSTISGCSILKNWISASPCLQHRFTW